MTSELRALGVADLVRLGGLRKACDAPLVCSVHTNPHPCELCELEGSPSVACSVCHHEFADGRVSGGERPCASESVFSKSGKIAFEAQALAAFAREREDEGERKKRQKEEARRKREEKARSERADAERIEREERARREKELAERAREEAARARAKAEADRADAGTRGIRWAKRSRWTALGASIMGALMLWERPLVVMPETGGWYRLMYAAVVLLVWVAGTRTLVRPHKAHETLGWWSPLVWGFTHLAWPGVAGLAVCFLAGWYGLPLFQYLLFFATGVGLMLLAVVCVTHCSVAFSMKPPWPPGFISSDFKGMRSVTIWVAMAATLALNLKLMNGSSDDLPLTGWLSPTPAGARPLLVPVAEKPAPEKDAKAYARAHLADIADAVHAHPRMAMAALAGAIPRVDAAVQALRQLPRPPSGDKAAARALMVKAGQMMAGEADWPQVVHVLQQAHESDRQDVQALNELAYAQVMAGRPGPALTSAIGTLTLAPTRANAWATLGLVRAALADDNPLAIQEAARYYVVAYWFSSDRRRTLQVYKARLTPGPHDPPSNPAAVAIALQRLAG